MSPRKLLLLICLTLGSSLIVEDFANAQRGGRSSGGGRSMGSSAGRSSGGGRSMGSSGRSMGSSRSSGRSIGSSRSSSSPIRSSSSQAGRSSRSYTTPSTSSSRGITPSRPSASSSSSRTLRTSPTDLGRSSASSRISPGIGSSSSSTRPLDSASAIERLTGRGSSSGTPSAPRTGLGGPRTAPATSPYDLSRRVSTFDTTPGARDQGLDQATVRMPASSGARSARTSSVPQPYSSGASRRATNLPSTARRDALSERLRAATSIRTSADAGTRGLADRYSPSANERSSLSTRLRDSGRSSRAREQAAAGATRPGKARLDALGLGATDAATKRAQSARDQARQTRTENGRKQRSEADQAKAEKRVQSARKQYKDAVAKDEALRKRMAGASASAAVAGDIGLRAALAANPLTGAYGGYYGTGNPWGGYAYGGWCNWYWNSCFPYWSNWWWGGCGFGFGFGWGWGGCYGWGYNPCWSWPCYYPSYGWNYCWPTYAFWSPAVVYSYVEVPVYTTVAQAPTETLVEPEVTVERAPDFGKRAATEYMALGDRAFTEGRYGDAVHYYAKAIEYSPSDGVLYLVLSDALFATGDYHYAAFTLRRSLELNPELASLGLDKRSFYGIPADFDKQLAVLERFVLDHPIDDDARLMLSANYLFSLQPEKSVQLLDEQYSLALRQSTGGQLIYAASAAMLAEQK